jgi:hypothetical protein
VPGALVLLQESGDFEAAIDAASAWLATCATSGDSIGTGNAAREDRLLHQDLACQEGLVVAVCGAGGKLTTQGQPWGTAITNTWRPCFGPSVTAASWLQPVSASPWSRLRRLLETPAACLADAVSPEVQDVATCLALALCDRAAVTLAGAAEAATVLTGASTAQHAATLEVREGEGAAPTSPLLLACRDLEAAFDLCTRYDVAHGLQSHIRDALQVCD